MTAADSVRILQTGALKTKTQLLSELKSRDPTYDPINLDDRSVKLNGNTAVVTAGLSFEDREKARHSRGGRRFYRVWVRLGKVAGVDMTGDIVSVDRAPGALMV